MSFAQIVEFKQILIYYLQIKTIAIGFDYRLIICKLAVLKTNL